MTHPDTPAPTRPFARRLYAVATAALVVALVAIALSGLGSRWGWWHFRTGFSILKWGAYAALAAAALTIVSALLRRDAGRRRALVIAAGLSAIALGIVAVPWQMRRAAQSVPRIHDVTTDTDNPPAFVALRNRPGARNPVEYGGAEVAAQQRAGYPDIGPVMLPVAPPEAVARAAAAARELGWTIAAVDTAAGRVEATDRTRWFGFYDDVVIRVTPAEGGSRVDVRSLSRVGGSDVGANAARIRRFLARLQRGA